MILLTHRPYIISNADDHVCIELILISSNLVTLILILLEQEVNVDQEGVFGCGRLPFSEPAPTNPPASRTNKAAGQLFTSVTHQLNWTSQLGAKDHLHTHFFLDSWAQRNPETETKCVLPIPEF